ncbi:caspase-3-like [Haliotis cracherodii]|uniref:caspase-3-like n=1 Tax=Haliotis cracherodii TaxID=6455 RepID=UPI0039EB81A6
MEEVQGREQKEENTSDDENADGLTTTKIKKFFMGTDKGGKNGTKPDANRKSPPGIMESNAYDFRHPRRGIAVIINNKKFVNPRHRRDGSEIDVIRLTKMFTCYGFDIVIYNDLTVDEMVATLKMVACFPDHERADCFACAISSHGDEVTIKKGTAAQDAIMGIGGDLVLTKVLLDIFTDAKCPGLRGKPRLFFIQACRGELMDDGQEIVISKLTLAPQDEGQCSIDAKVKEESKKGSHPSPLCPPIDPHFLVMYASPPGHAAWRRTDGSWFTRCLADTFLSTNVETTSLTKVLTRVSGAVTQLQSKDGKKQVPCTISKLTKDVYFTAKRYS